MVAATGGWPGLEACLKKPIHRPSELAASSKLSYSISVENHCSGKPGHLDAESFQVLLEVLPPGEWHFVRLLWLACSSFLAYWPIALRSAHRFVVGSGSDHGKSDHRNHSRYAAR